MNKTKIAFEAWSHLGSLTSTQTSSATEFQRDSLQVQTCKQPFFFSLLLLGDKSSTHHWKLQSRQRQFVTYLCIEIKMKWHIKKCKAAGRQNCSFLPQHNNLSQPQTRVMLTCLEMWMTLTVKCFINQGSYSG